MSKESMDERFDEDFVKSFPDGSERWMRNIEIRDIKAFLRQELADQKARAIEIVNDHICGQAWSKENSHEPTCQDEPCQLAISTALEKEL